MTEAYVEMPSGLVLPEYFAEELAHKLNRPKAVDLFCGCGGASLGFIQAGYEVVGAIDWDCDAAQTYMCNLGTYPCQFHFVEDSDRKRFEKSLSRAYKSERRKQIEIPFTAGSGWIQKQEPRPPGVQHFWLGDICKVKGRDILDAVGLDVGELDCVLGSPPCQGFSRANKNSGPDDPRNELIFEWARLIIEMRPKTCVMENVPGVAKMQTRDGLPILEAVMRVLQDGDFAGLDALRASLKQQRGIAFMRNRKPKKERQAEAAEKAAKSAVSETDREPDEEAETWDEVALEETEA